MWPKYTTTKRIHGRTLGSSFWYLLPTGVEIWIQFQACSSVFDHKLNSWRSSHWQVTKLLSCFTFWTFTFSSSSLLSSSFWTFILFTYILHFFYLLLSKISPPLHFPFCVLDHKRILLRSTEQAVSLQTVFLLLSFFFGRQLTGSFLSFINQLEGTGKSLNSFLPPHLLSYFLYILFIFSSSLLHSLNEHCWAALASLSH